MRRYWRNGAFVVLGAVALVGAVDAVLRIEEAFGSGWLLKEADNLGALAGALVAGLISAGIAFLIVQMSVRPVWQQVNLQSIAHLLDVRAELQAHVRVWRASEERIGLLLAGIPSQIEATRRTGGSADDDRRARADVHSEVADGLAVFVRQSTVFGEARVSDDVLDRSKNEFGEAIESLSISLKELAQECRKKKSEREISRVISSVENNFKSVDKMSGEYELVLRNRIREIDQRVREIGSDLIATEPKRGDR